jgi:hypothetical protein
MGYYTRFSLAWSKTPEWVSTPACEHSNSPNVKFCPECGRPNKVVELDAIVGAYIVGHENMVRILT